MESDGDSEVATSRRPPHFCIKQKSAWLKILHHLADNGIYFHRAVNSSDSVRLYLESVDDVRELTAHLEEKKIQYTTHQLREDKDLIVVIRGVNESLPKADIKEELERRKFPVKSVYRMRKGKKIWPLVPNPPPLVQSSN